MPGGININDGPNKSTSSKKTKKTKPGYYYKPAEPADSMSTQAIGKRYVLLENIKTRSQKNGAKGVLQNATVLTIARSEVEDKGLDQPEKGGDWPERVEVPNNLDQPIEKGGDWLENNLDRPREEGGNRLGNDLDQPMEEGGDRSENDDDLPKEGDDQEGEEDQPEEGEDLTEEEDVEVLPVELEEPPILVANESADEIENILEEDMEGVDYQKKKGNKRKTCIRVNKETTYVMESRHDETMKKMSRINASSRIKPVEDRPMSEVQLTYVSRDPTPQGIAGSISTSLAKRRKEEDDAKKIKGKEREKSSPQKRPLTPIVIPPTQVSVKQAKQVVQPCWTGGWLPVLRVTGYRS